MPSANICPDLIERCEKFLRSSDAGERNDRRADKTRFYPEMRRQNVLAGGARHLGHLTASFSRPNDKDGIDVPNLCLERRPQRPGGHAEPVADPNLAINHGNREIRFDLPALQAIIKHEHAWIDGAPRE